MEFANQRWFDRHDALPTARGGNSRDAIVAANGDIIGWVTNGGIAAPVRAELLPPTRIIRFAGSYLPGTAMQGGWWLEFAEYRRVEAYADLRKIDVSIALRLLCCVPLEWNRMTCVVQARLRSPLLAYRGEGAPAIKIHKATKTTEYLSGRPDGAGGAPVTQLYIPGLGSGDLCHDSLILEGYGFPPESASRDGYIIRPA